MATDVVAAIKHVRSNAEEYGVDVNRMVMHGNSGGGYAVLAASSLMAKNNESNLINFVIAS
jgi:acetyl esterase/lipase